jgi:phosphoglycolate/pyridoxal phosphate phosphatase family enzyme
MDNLERLLGCRLFLLDMDGTLYLGDTVFDGAVDFIHTLEDTGRSYIYLTNNSSRSGSDYVTRLRRLGFPCLPENVYTSGMATARYLTENFPGENVYVVGTRTFHEELKRAGIRVVENSSPEVEIADQVGVVCVGFDTELVYHDLERAVHFLRQGKPFIAANPDWVCPMPGGEVLPDCGSMCALLTASTGVKPVYIGKPDRRMVDIIARERGIPNDRICCVGDRLYTDIAVAQNAGAVSVLVLSGETTQAMADAAERKPDYILRDVRELAGILRKRSDD